MATASAGNKKGRYSMIQETGIFGNNGRTANPAMAEVAFNLARNSSNIASAAQQAAQALLATTIPVDGEIAENHSATDLARPMLAPPSFLAAAPRELSGAAKLTQLLGELGQLLLNSGQAELEGRIEQFKQMAKSQQDAAIKASQEFETSLTESEHAVKTRGAAEAAFKHAEQQRKAASSAVSNARAALDKLPPTLVPEPGSSLERKNPAYVMAQQHLDKTSMSLQNAVMAMKQEKTALSTAHKAAVDSVRHTASLETEALKIGGAMPDNAALLATLGSATARLTLLMSQLSKLVEQSSEDNLKNDREMFEAMQSERQKALEKAAEDFLAESAKAEHTAKVMGCIGKIVGALLTVVSIIAIPFTGGASAALAVIGIGMMVADVAVKAATGTSLTERVIAPLMEHVIMPVIKLLADAISKALMAVGVPEKQARVVAEVMAAVITAIAVIVIVVLLAMVSTALVAKMVAKMAPAMLRAASRALPGVVRKLGSASAKKIGNVANTASTVIGTAGAAVTAGGSIAQGVFTKRASDHHAEIIVTAQILQQLQRYLQAAVEGFSEKIKMANQLMATAAETSARSTENKRAIISRIRG